jgi:dephospho-CoA kinase
MREQTFVNLDAEIKKRGGSRAASVRSDILLHVPESFKNFWGIDDDYIVFVGQQYGKIVEHEFDYQSNLIFPWLDNKTFNKWFQPDGCGRPLGALKIAEADKVDFRRKSFEALFNFLALKGYLQFDIEQFELAFDHSKNFILCGYTCCGKTTAAQYLSRHYGYVHVEASDFMHLNYYYRHGFQGDVKIGDFAEQALAEKPEIAAERVAAYIKQNWDRPIVISGFRAPGEIKYIEDHLATRGKSFSTVFIDSDADIRFQRMNARQRPGDNIEKAKFTNRDLQQKRMGLDTIRDLPATNHMANSGTLLQYFQNIEIFVEAEQRDEISIAKETAGLDRISDLKLEEAILVALLTVWEDTESRQFYTTTQISKLINDKFKGLTKKKHKDNVSRYFNQDFYAYYEISGEPGKTLRKYRLSNTGYGKALQALRSRREFGNSIILEDGGPS